MLLVMGLSPLSMTLHNYTLEHFFLLGVVYVVFLQVLSSHFQVSGLAENDMTHSLPEASWGVDITHSRMLQVSLYHTAHALSNLCKHRQGAGSKNLEKTAGLLMMSEEKMVAQDLEC